MIRPACLVSVLFATAIFGEVAGAQQEAEEPGDTLVGVLRVHPKFHYRYYIDGFGDGQQCALFQADKHLKEIEPGSLILVRGDLASKQFGGDPQDESSALIRTWIIYMDVEQVEVLRGPLKIDPRSTPPPTSKASDKR